jgi:hypothetical protein
MTYQKSAPMKGLASIKRKCDGRLTISVSNQIKEGS